MKENPLQRLSGIDEVWRIAEGPVEEQRSVRELGPGILPHPPEGVPRAGDQAHQNLLEL